MPYGDLENFRIDCRIKQEQILFLQSMRSSQDTRLVAGFENYYRPWEIFTNLTAYRQRAQIHNGYTNWLINQHLLKLSYQCP